MGKSTPSVIVHIVRLRTAKAIKLSALSDTLYENLVAELAGVSKDQTKLQGPKELKITDDVEPLTKSIKALMSSMKGQALFIEYFLKKLDSIRYDDLCQALTSAIENLNSSRLKILGVCVKSHAFLRSVILEEKLIPACEKKKVSLVVITVGARVETHVLSCREKLGGKVPSPISDGVAERVMPLTEDQIASQFHAIFGHFEIRKDGDRFHLPILASSSALSRNLDFLGQMREHASEKLGVGNFDILPLGIPGGGIAEVALALAEGDSQRLITQSGPRQDPQRPLLVLCDILSPFYPISRIAKTENELGCQKITVIGIGGYLNREKIDGVESTVYVEIPFNAVCVSQGEECMFCQQVLEEEEAPAGNSLDPRASGKVIIGEDFNDFATSIGQFAPIVFWEFLHQNKYFTEVGHWEANRTKNHYLFTIRAKLIFDRFSFDVSLRFRNLLESKNIMPEWVDKIFCPDDEELILLTETFARVLGRTEDDIVRVPRKFMNSVVGREIDEDLQKHLSHKYGKKRLENQNVLIVDQAAHHFRTLSSLRAICEFYRCTIFAFLVFVDRTEPEFSLVEFLPGSHYLSLYSWPVPPKRKNDCPCSLRSQN